MISFLLWIIALAVTYHYEIWFLFWVVLTFPVWGIILMILFFAVGALLVAISK